MGALRFVCIDTGSDLRDGRKPWDERWRSCSDERAIAEFAVRIIAPAIHGAVADERARVRCSRGDLHDRSAFAGQTQLALAICVCVACFAGRAGRAGAAAIEVGLAPIVHAIVARGDLTEVHCADAALAIGCDEAAFSVCAIGAAWTAAIDACFRAV